MSIADLLEFLPPPAQPRIISSRQHEIIEQGYPFPFPADFIEFCRLYGPGRIDSNYPCLDIYNPLARQYLAERNQDLINLVLLMGGMFQEGRPFPYGILPCWPALVPLAHCSAGYGVYWLIRSADRISTPDFLITCVDGRHQEADGPFLAFIERFLAVDESLMLWEGFDIDEGVKFRFAPD